MNTISLSNGCFTHALNLNSVIVSTPYRPICGKSKRHYARHEDITNPLERLESESMQYENHGNGEQEIGGKISQ